MSQPAPWWGKQPTGTAAAAVRRWQRDFAQKLFVTDFVVVVAAIFGSQLIWFGSGAAELQIATSELGTFTIGYTLVSLAMSALWLIALASLAARDPKIIGSGSLEYKHVVGATFRVFGIVAIAMFLLKSELGRGYFLTALPVGLVLLLVGRWAWRQWLVRRREAGEYVHQALLVGDRTKTEHIVQSLSRDVSSGLRLVGAVTKNGTVSESLANGIPVLGDFAGILDAVEGNGIDTVIFTGSDDLGPRRLRELGWQLESRDVGLIVAPSLTDVAGPRIHARPVAGLPLIQVEYPTFEGGKHLAKRASDVVLSGLAFIILSPVFLWITVAIRRDSSGAALFRQERVGLNGATFGMLKFRSMVTDAEAQLHSLLDQSEGNGVLFKLKEDPRITQVGRFLRRYSLDELPQLVNVFRGEMSLVGPRPPLAREVEQYDEWAHRRLLVKPGITGLWQVSGRSELSWEDSVRLDLYYVENWSLTGDIVILWRTVNAVLRAQGAY